jgi:hypothetical protein
MVTGNDTLTSKRNANFSKIPNKYQNIIPLRMVAIGTSVH